MQDLFFLHFLCFEPLQQAVFYCSPKAFVLSAVCPTWWMDLHDRKHVNLNAITVTYTCFLDYYNSERHVTCFLAVSRLFCLPFLTRHHVPQISSWELANETAGPLLFHPHLAAISARCAAFLTLQPVPRRPVIPPWLRQVRSPAWAQLKHIPAAVLAAPTPPLRVCASPLISAARVRHPVSCVVWSAAFRKRSHWPDSIFNLAAHKF